MLGHHEGSPTEKGILNYKTAVGAPTDSRGKNILSVVATPLLCCTVHSANVIYTQDNILSGVFENHQECHQCFDGPFTAFVDCSGQHFLKIIF